MTALPPGWIELQPAEALALETELRREINPTHQLYGRDLRAVARRGARDDVLFVPRDGDKRVFWVHLTWSIESDPQWPWTEGYSDQNAFAARWPEGETDGSDEEAG